MLMSTHCPQTPTLLQRVERTVTFNIPAATGGTGEFCLSTAFCWKLLFPCLELSLQHFCCAFLEVLSAGIDMWGSNTHPAMAPVLCEVLCEAVKLLCARGWLSDSCCSLMVLVRSSAGQSWRALCWSLKLLSYL